ncbi:MULTISPECIES: hypothetical protein [Pseudoalteromonas]|uniref:hypothetical protein n=1 Tax=Pseudoalteromonas TaxID=53246 RepID=UPI0016815EC9|nr:MULTISPECIES: hypothetical protein [Pseudoalteromonas]MBD1584004.1 hypothetical protein [Pseudoalteromonas sp. S16_S37]MBR8843877.1 hypothetical protein [Pseudoalteromonas sp. JC3]UDM60736.1 hypothetical protein KIJ96_13035 [Pseudoalteromonas piscicida]WJE08124.1 hypothetical protein QSH61_14700 [Pseudoalteromonas sp. JC3]
MNPLKFIGRFALGTAKGLVEASLDSEQTESHLDQPIEIDGFANSRWMTKDGKLLDKLDDKSCPTDGGAFVRD